MQKFIVCWMTYDPDDNSKYIDHYEVFQDGDSTSNKREANKKYKKLLEDELVYSANICEIIESTDY